MMGKWARFTAQLDYLPEMLQFVKEVTQSAGFGKREVNRVQIAVEEALVNIIKYTYMEGEGGIEILCDIDDQKLCIEIIDEGVPFNPLSVGKPDISLPLEEREIGGLGIYIMRQIMDEVLYRREGGKNILTLVKYV